jgi:hypothetical protein
MSEENSKQCEYIVYKRDTLRYTGRTKSGFEVHYTKRQCSRKAKDGCKYCAQHKKLSPT